MCGTRIKVGIGSLNAFTRAVIQTERNTIFRTQTDSIKKINEYTESKQNFTTIILI